MKILEIEGKKYEFQHMEMKSDHHFSEQELILLKKIDEGLTNASTKKDVESLQKQMNAIFIKQAELGCAPIGSPKSGNPEERKLNAKWIKAIIQKKDPTSIEMELKAFDTDSYLDTGDTSTGGVIVPNLLQAEIFAIINQGGIARREMRYLPFSGPGGSRKLPIEGSGVSVSWIDEFEKKGLTKITLDYVTQSIKVLASIGIFTDELIEDASVDIVAYTARRIGEAIMAEEDNQFFAGTGAPWTGIINAAGTVPVELAAGKVLSDIGPSDLLDMVFSIPTNCRSGAKFYCSSDVLLYLMKYRADAVAESDNRGPYLLVPPTGSQPGTIWGYPVVTTDALPGTTEADEADVSFMFFSNLKKCAVYGDKQGLRVKILDQASLEDADGNTINLAQVDSTAVRVSKRVGYCLPLVGGISVLSTGSTS